MTEQKEEIKGVEFSFIEVEKKPKRKYRKGSMYDPLIQSAIAQLEKGNTLLKVAVVERDSNYMRTQLKKRIDALELNDVMEVSVVNNELYIGEPTIKEVSE